MQQRHTGSVAAPVPVDNNELWYVWTRDSLPATHLRGRACPQHDSDSVITRRQCQSEFEREHVGGLVCVCVF
jgi:hypothetical protein